MNIGFILIDNINNKIDLDKIKLMEAIGNYNKNRDLIKEKELKKIEEYKNKYELPRKNNQDNYNKYIINYNKKYNTWMQTRTVKDLLELVLVKKPIFQEVPDIYTAFPK